MQAGSQRFQTYSVYYVMNNLVWIKDSTGALQGCELDKVRVPFKHTRFKVLNQKGCKCVNCGVEGIFFARELDQMGTECLHLYGMKDGNEVMITMDHIVPKSKGGGYTTSNLQPMCEVCNVRKSNHEDQVFKQQEAVKFGVGTTKEIVVYTKGNKFLVQIKDKPECWTISTNLSKALADLVSLNSQELGIKITYKENDGND